MERPAVEELRAGLKAAIAACDRPAAARLAVERVAAGTVTIPELHRVLGEELADVGRDWQRGRTAVWQEHLASAIVRTVIEAVYPLLQLSAAAPNGRTIVLACPEDEAHDLGLRMLADRFELAGFTVIYLGADTPAAEIARAGLATNAEAVLLSASTHFRVVRLRSTIETIEGEVPGLRVLVGGPALCDPNVQAAAGHIFDPNEFFDDIVGLEPSCELE